MPSLGTTNLLIRAQLQWVSQPVECLHFSSQYANYSHMLMPRLAPVFISHTCWWSVLTVWKLQCLAVAAEGKEGVDVMSSYDPAFVNLWVIVPSRTKEVRNSRFLLPYKAGCSFRFPFVSCIGIQMKEKWTSSTCLTPCGGPINFSRYEFLYNSVKQTFLFRWPCCLRRRSAAARSLKLRVRIPLRV